MAVRKATLGRAVDMGHTVCGGRTAGIERTAITRRTAAGWRARRRRTASIWRTAWLCIFFVLLLLLCGAMPQPSAAQDGGQSGAKATATADETGGNTAAPDEAGTDEEAEPAEPVNDAGENGGGDEASKGEDDTGEAVEITTVTKTEVTTTSDSSQSADGKTSTQSSKETYVKTETSGTLPAGTGLAPDEDIETDPYKLLLDIDDKTPGELTRHAWEEDAVDFSDFIVDNIELYYYPDVRRLMQILNPRSYEVDGKRGARERLLQARRGLEAAERKVAEKEAAVRDKLGASSAAFANLEALLTKRNMLQAQLSYKEQELERLSEQLIKLTKAKADADADDTSLIETYGEMIEAKEKSIADVTAEIETLKTQLGAATTAAEDTTVTTAVKTAVDELAQARREHQQQKEQALAYAEVENMAYAYARDNAPFWVAPAQAASDKCDCQMNNSYLGLLNQYVSAKAEIDSLKQQLAYLRSQQAVKENEQENLDYQISFIKHLLKKTPKDKELTQHLKLLEGELHDVKASLDWVAAEISKKNALLAKDSEPQQQLAVAYEQLQTGYSSECTDCLGSMLPPATTDPVNRVFMFAFEDRAVIILRGRAEDVRQARQVIRAYDVPAPMARVTLWSLELNSTASRKGARQTNRALELIDREFSTTRAQLEAAQSILKDVIADEVARCQSKKVICGGNKYDGAWRELTSQEPVFRRYKYYSADVLAAFGFNLAEPAQILLKKEEKEQAENANLEYLKLMRHVIPDPVAVNTLGEAMLVLCLGNAESRRNIARQFKSRLADYLEEAGLYCSTDGSSNGCVCDTCPIELDRLCRALGIDEYANTGSTDSLTPKQSVIVEAIKRDRIRNMMGAAAGLILEADRMKTEIKQLCYVWIIRAQDASQVQNGVGKFQDMVSTARQDDFPISIKVDDDVVTDHLPQELAYEIDSYLRDNPVDLDLRTSKASLATNVLREILFDREFTIYQVEATNLLKSHASESQTDLARLAFNQGQAHRSAEAKANVIGQWLADEFGIELIVIKDVLTRSFNNQREEWYRQFPDMRGSPRQFDHDETILRNILDRVYEQYCGSNPLRQVAKGDEMLKEFHKAFEDELDAEFIQPMLTRLRQQLEKEGIGVGVLQRTSILVTNRKTSRIEPLANAQLRMGEDQDLLLEAQLLNNIYQEAKLGNFQDVLESLGELNQEEDTSEIYGLRSGNRFEVTPVFDASGQAYRFQFDHVYSTVITNPDGSTARTNLDLPRIERTSINTDVQLSQDELREVSRFESNVSLGITGSQSGGIPVLRHIPGLSEIPLIGWFKRRVGKSAVVQQHIIFAQTAIYPTISDIAPLMTAPILVVGDRQY